MLFERHDYLLLNVDDKPQLAQVLNVGDKKRRKNQAILESGIEGDDPVKVEFVPKDIVANLGSQPRRGSKVYGVDIQLFEDTIAAKGFPFEIFSYREMSDKDEENFLKALYQAKKILTKHKAKDWMASVERMVIKPKTGKYAGYYKMKNIKGGGAADEIGLHPENFDFKSELLFLIMHEMSHGIWYRQVSSPIRAKWTRLFAKRAVLSRSTQDSMLSLFSIVSSIFKETSTFSEVRKQLKAEYDEENRLFGEVLSHVRKVWHLDVEEMEALMLKDSKKFFSLWPTVSDLTDWKYDVSEYATKNVKEFFAESMAYYLTGTKLPVDVSKFCKRTLANLTKLY